MRAKPSKYASVAASLAIFVWLGGPAAAAGPASSPEVVVTDRGAVQGTPDGATITFKGIPYAAPPVGSLRWRPPAEVTPWKGVRDATRFGNICPQLSEGIVVGSEDCLTLNLWKPAGEPSEPLPVMVWLHGGGNHAGSSVPFSGRRWAQTENVVFVTTNYRVGALGFLAHPALDAESDHHASGNYGVLDQVAALRWVQRNAAAFGGDPSRVLIFGESAGADDVCVHLASPLSAGLFHRAVMESLVAGCRYQTLAQFEQGTGARIVAQAGCAGAPDVAACLRSRPAAAVVAAVPGKLDLNPRIYGPIVDGFVLEDSPLEVIREGDHNPVPMIVGSNAEETSVRVGSVPDEATYRSRAAERWGAALAEQVLAVYPVAAYPTAQAAFTAATTDEIHTCPTRRVVAAAAEEQDAPVFRFLFTHALQNDLVRGKFGASHGFELEFLFEGLRGYVPVGAEIELSRAMVANWAQLARAGDPNGPGRTAWPVSQPDSDAFLRLDTPITAAAGVRTAQCDFWDEVLEELG